MPLTAASEDNAARIQRTEEPEVAEQRKRERPADYFADWKEREALAEAMIPQVGAMARTRNVK
ncbi:MAG: hypothetical protein EBY62_08425, partial [Cellvibrionales bacterium]|nr:hypothetical protein [Cellvibrionales bacterium]